MTDLPQDTIIPPPDQTVEEIRRNRLIANFVTTAGFIEDSALRAACLRIITEYPEFTTAPAARGYHHAYRTGLIQHTLEVTHYALTAANVQTLGVKVNKDVLIAAALWHDLAKIWEYATDPLTGTSFLLGDYGRRIHHIQGSMAEFTRWAHTEQVDIGTIRAVQHCILAHHGRKDWGSIKEPDTVEATLLHQADYLSAHYGLTRFEPES